MEINYGPLKRNKSDRDGGDRPRAFLRDDAV